MSDLIEDDDGAPYAECMHCPDQVCPPGELSSNPVDWVHIYEGPDGGRWGLNNCQRPTVGRYGEYRATPYPDVLAAWEAEQ